MPPRRNRARNAAPARAAQPAAPSLHEPKSTPIAYDPVRRVPARELSVLGAFVALLMGVSLWLHYSLPLPMQSTTVTEPLPEYPITDAWYDALSAGELDATTLPMYMPSTAALEGSIVPYFSEGNAMLTIQHLAGDIGYRVVGTQQHVDAEKWAEDILRRYVGTHDTGDGSYQTHVELFTQIGDGAHRFEILGYPVWKQYYNMTNLIVRISDGSEQSKNNTLLLNAHLDSTPPSPGGADDGAGVAIMFEVLRILTLRGAPRVRNGLILLFNNGEESLQDASHMYMTQHNETNHAVRAVLNMEACGVSGPTLLFQATDPLLIDAYAKVPHPFATVVASDVFSSGVIMSDTDFRQFEEYGNGTPGLDMAIVGSSYLYHTRRDVPAHIEHGVLQHFGENVLSLVQSLSLEPDSPMKRLAHWQHKVRQIMPIYFSVFGRYFVSIPPKTFKMIVIFVSLASNFVLGIVNSSDTRVSTIHYAVGCAAGVFASFLAALGSANLVAALMRALGMPMSWFAHEFYAIALYAPPALAAVVAVQILLSACVEKSRRPYLEHASFTGPVLFFTLGLLLMNSFGLGSAYLMLLSALTNLIPITINDFLFIGISPIAMGQVPVDRRVRFATYFFSVISACTVGIEGFVSFMDLIVPLLGRMGKGVPVDFAIASLVAALATLNSIALVPLLHRYGAGFARNTFTLLLLVSGAAIAFFALPGVPTFDALHPRRLLINHVENITSGEWHVAMSQLDGASANPRMDAAIQSVLLQGLPNATLSWANNGAAATDMDVLFPLSNHIGADRIVLPSTSERQAATNEPNRWSNYRLTCSEEVVDKEAKTRSFLMRLYHPGLAWSTMSFDADVIDWEFPAPPPRGFQRHHLKDVSRIDAHTWQMRIKVRVSDEQFAAFEHDKGAPADTLVRSPPLHPEPPLNGWRMQVHFSGFDAYGMYPHHKDTGMDKVSMKTLASLDALFQEEFPEIDPMLMSVIAGVAEC
ncbi:hypothetical protein MVES1_000153 [Malassezia vespertilionis]|uniref:Peptide hydrolase n=1 Tax=Malassezia vespertilionis TaxID=2020962 RepID=A0A2N1JHF7_9BASI|nr:uncharacterized protein MVES1_000153 [Malassezia vespertilionis]PKI85984.1 hypothetical protein MVES_000151 [Malassezia vespertilionis]WFD04829.1 hypothetical protein MVES1_000153 [Malassezia vespertilionis]